MGRSIDDALMAARAKRGAEVRTLLGPNDDSASQHLGAAQSPQLPFARISARARAAHTFFANHDRILFSRVIRARCDRDCPPLAGDVEPLPRALTADPNEMRAAGYLERPGAFAHHARVDENPVSRGAGVGRNVSASGGNAAYARRLKGWSVSKWRDEARNRDDITA